MIFPKKIHIAHAIPHWFCALFCAIVLLGGPLTATAQPKSSAGQHQPRHAVQTRQKFLLDKTVYVTSDFEHSNTAAELAQWLRSKGVAASNALNKASNRIILQKVHSIEGASGSDAWQITIKSRRITVSFTSENSLQYALHTLQNRIIKGPNGALYLQGGVLADWGARTAARDHGAIIDAATSLRSVGDLEAAIKRLGSRSKEIYLVLVDNNHWRMESPSLEAACTAGTLYPSDGYYRTEQLQQILAAAQRNRIEIIPTLELLSDNSTFRSTFGHSNFSVEGMRLVRAAIEDCIKALHPAKISLGTISPQADMRYMEFISNLASMLGVELMIIEP